MLLKEADSKEASIKELESLIKTAPVARKKIEEELRLLRAGIKGEKEAAYFIDFDFKSREEWIIIHDLRLTIGERVAQIDHLLINRALNCYVLETKHFSDGLKVTDEGDFLRWNSYKKTYEGMASPLAQNDRHIAVLKDLLEKIEMPVRFGVKLLPNFYSYILVSPNARIDRPKKFDTTRIIKADDLKRAINERVERMGVLETLAGATKLVSIETLTDMARILVRWHTPLVINYWNKFGIPSSATQSASDIPPSSQTASTADLQRPIIDSSHKITRACRECGNTDLAIQYGKNYYFKCHACNGNTPIKLGCGHTEHKERLRKDGNHFYRECEDCKTSFLYFTNP